MKSIRPYINDWKRLPASVKWFIAGLAFSVPRLGYLWWIRDSVVLAWFDLGVIAIFGFCHTTGWLLLVRQIRTAKRADKQSRQIYDHWDTEITALSYELFEASSNPDVSSEQIDAIHERIDEAHRRRDLKLEAMKKTP